MSFAKGFDRFEQLSGPRVPSGAPAGGQHQQFGHCWGILYGAQTADRVGKPRGLEV